MGLIGKKITVNSNKEFRTILHEMGIVDSNIKSLSIKLWFRKWSTYESDVNYIDLEYKGYKYELQGRLEEKWSETSLYSDSINQEPFRTISQFLNKIQNHEINVLEDYLDYEYIGEPDSWSFVDLKWLTHTPEEIQKEFYNTHKLNDIRDQDKMEYYGSTGNFYHRNNNIDYIHFHVTTGTSQFEIEWVNNFDESEAPHLNDIYNSSVNRTIAQIQSDKYNYSAWDKLESGKLNEALIDIEKSLHYLAYADNTDTAAMIHYKLGNYEQGLKFANQSIQLDEWKEDHYLTRAKIYLKMNQVDSAKSDLKKCIELGEEEPIKEAIKLLKSL